MPDLNTPGARVQPFPKGVIARAADAVRYVITGVTPQTWFGPLQPLKPMAPEGTGGRAFDYSPGYNLQTAPRYNEPISFSDLHMLANNCDMLGIIIESRKDQIEGQEWEIRPRKLADGTHPKASGFATQIKAAKDFFAYPDKEHALPQWLREIAHEVFVTDAASVYVRPDRKGRVYGFEVLDGSTIIPRIDAYGRTPAAPDVAYQQILHGIPAADFSRDQLVYFPRNKRPGHVYGYSPVEQVILTANTLIRREMHQLAFYTDGNLTDAIFNSPAGWSKDQIAGWQQYWDSMFVGNVAARRTGMWVPDGVKYQALKPPVLKDPYDEFLARIICFALKVSPQPFVSMMNRATADTAHDAAIEEGLLPFLNWFEDLFRRLFDILGWTEIEMVTVDDRETDPEAAAALDVADVKAGIRTINEVRAGRGLDPIPGGDIPMVETATGYVDIRANLQPEDGGPEPQEPEPAPAGVAAGGDERGAGAAKIAHMHKRKHGKVVRKLPAIKQGAVAKGAKKSIAARYADALAKAGKRAAKQVREKLLKTDDDPNRRAAEIAGSVEFAMVNDIGEDTADDLAAVIAAAGQAQLAQLGLGTDDGMFGVVNKRAVKAAADQSAELVSNIDDATRSALQDLIAKGLANGDSIDEIAEAIASMKVGGSNAFGEDRADLIANTEVANANSQGALEGAKAAAENGVDLKKVWLIADDGCCDDCQDNSDAGAINLDDDFPSGDSEPTAHPNCRCAISFEVQEDVGAGESDLAEAA